MAVFCVICCGAWNRPRIGAISFRYAHEIDSLSWTAPPRPPPYYGGGHRPELRFRTESTQVLSCPATAQNKTALWRFCLLVAGPGIEPGSGGYEPPEVPLLYPAMY